MANRSVSNRARAKSGPGQLTFINPAFQRIAERIARNRCADSQAIARQRWIGW